MKIFSSLAQSIFYEFLKSLISEYMKRKIFSIYSLCILEEFEIMFNSKKVTLNSVSYFLPVGIDGQHYCLRRKGKQDQRSLTLQNNVNFMCYLFPELCSIVSCKMLFDEWICIFDRMKLKAITKVATSNILIVHCWYQNTSPTQNSHCCYFMGILPKAPPHYD